VNQYQKGKTNVDLLKQEIVIGSGISLAICTSAPRTRPRTKPRQHPSTQFFSGQMPVLPPNQQRHSAQGNN